jgi:hypothetical protein
MRFNFFITFYRFLGNIIFKRIVNRRKRRCTRITPKIDTIQMDDLNISGPKSPVSLTASEEMLYI